MASTLLHCKQLDYWLSKFVLETRSDTLQTLFHLLLICYDMTVNATDQTLISPKIAPLQDLGRRWMEKWNNCTLMVLELLWGWTTHYWRRKLTLEGRLTRRPHSANSAGHNVVITLWYELCPWKWSRASELAGDPVSVSWAKRWNLVYIENCSNNKSGGLSDQVMHHANEAIQIDV